MSPFGLDIRRSQPFPKNASFRITSAGREKLMAYSGTPQARILANLESNGTSDCEELASYAGMSRGTVERVLKTLLQKGYVGRVGGGEDNRNSPFSTEELS